MLRVGFIYDERFLRHKNDLILVHPETPERVQCPHETLQQRGVLEKLQHLEPRKATLEEIYSVHDKSYVEKFANAKGDDDSFFADFDRVVLPTYNEVFKDCKVFTYYNELTYDTALLSAGSSLKLTEAVIDGTVDSGFALIRPPGHHADKCSAAGFCFFNNVAIAARYAQSKGVTRVMIIDWDIHHGNGTQDEFYEENEVLYLSLHRYNTYPGLEKAKADRIGKGKGRGYNINIAWDGETMMGEGDYKCAFEEIVLPVAKRYQPELVLVSCGFDAARGDPLGEYDVTINTYSWMTSQLMKLGVKLAIVYEGGYNINNLKEGVHAVVTTLLGENEPNQISSPVSDDGKKSIENCKNYIKEFWF